MNEANVESSRVTSAQRCGEGRTKGAREVYDEGPWSTNIDPFNTRRALPANEEPVREW